MIKGIVAIVGRPNVGKSTLFNRLTRSKQAIVDDQPGVTRDRLYGTVKDDEGDGFVVIDTGGFETKDLYYQPFAKNIVWEQTEAAIKEADVVLLMFDGKSGLHPHDRQLVQYLKKQNKPVVYAVNKVDGREQASSMCEFYELGVDELVPVSSAHNRGVGELADGLRERLQALRPERVATAEDGAVKIAIIGKPNAGKSSILNRMTGEERSLVSDVAGTTRDAVDTPIVYNKKPYVLIDTAGIRRKTKIHDRLESFSVMRSLRVMDEADVVVLVITATEGLTDQDTKLISLVNDQYKPLLIVVNKWDLVENKHSNTARDYELDMRLKLGDMPHIPIIFVSCLENQRIHRIMGHVEELAEAYHKRVPTSRLNEALQDAVQSHTPALLNGHKKAVKFYYATQVRTAPPTIVIMCNVADEIQESYKRYLGKRLRKALDFGPTPIRVIYRSKKDNAQFKEWLESEHPETGANA